MQRLTEAHLLYQPRAACPPVPTEASSWAQILGRYRKPSHARSIIEIAITFGPLSALWALAWTALYLGYWWLCLLLAMPAAGFLVRLFMIQHDCGHGSFFHNRSANDWVGRVIGVHTLTPYDLWLIRKAAQMTLVGRPFVLASSAQLIQKSFFEPTARSFPICIGNGCGLAQLRPVTQQRC